MRVTFVRVADHRRGLAVVIRDDGVTYHLADGPVTGALPHDLIHFAVEDELAIADGIWGAIAGGVVFGSMTHMGGRRPPHAAERSAALIRAHRAGLQRAELIGGVVARVATGELDLRSIPDQFATQPDGGPDPDDVARAAGRVHAEAERWAECPVGAELVYTWPLNRCVGPAPVQRSARAERPAPRRGARGGRVRGHTR